MPSDYESSGRGLSKRPVEIWAEFWYFVPAMKHVPAAKILAKKSWGDFRLFRFETPGQSEAARPGQFVMVRVGDPPHPLLRRPISLHAKEDGALEIFFKIAGEGTNLLAKKNVGETLDVLGPLGSGFDLAEDLAGKNACLVGGGRGIAPLFFLGRELRARGAAVRVLYGGRTKDELPIRDKFAEAGLDPACATDDGTFGFSGFVTDLLETEIGNKRPDRLYVCGPDAMMRRCAVIAGRRGIPAQISLESIMGCGFGACWGCVKRLRKDGEGRFRKICEDGPVFAAEEIVWEEA
jgi:dihydroorotate dehydrogenase electron transfer subunit